MGIVKDSNFPTLGNVMMAFGWIHSFVLVGLFGGLISQAADKPLLADFSFEDVTDGAAWKTRAGSRWEMDSGKGFYRLVQPGKQGEQRRPLSWSVWQGKKVGAFDVEVRARCLTPTKVKGRDILIIFGFQDPDHYYYVHFSAENSKVHNIFAKVDGGERTPLPLVGERYPRLLEEGFQRLRLRHDPATGRIEASVDGKPVLSAVDRTFSGGYVGVGSFDDTVDFDQFTLSGSVAK